MTQRRRAEEIRERLVHDLGERVEELSALHATGRLLNELGGPKELLARVVELLPTAWQYPDITEARIAIGEIDVWTPQFTLTPWLQRAAFATPAGPTGVVEVVYRSSRPDADEGPFLAEERQPDRVSGRIAAGVLRAPSGGRGPRQPRASRKRASAGARGERGQGSVPGDLRTVSTCSWPTSIGLSGPDRCPMD